MNAKKEMDFYGARLSVHDIVQMQIKDFFNHYNMISADMRQHWDVNNEDGYFVVALCAITKINAPDVKIRAKKIAGEWDIQVQDADTWVDYYNYDWDVGDRCATPSFRLNKTCHLNLDGLLYDAPTTQIYNFLINCSHDEETRKNYCVEILDDYWYFTARRNGTIYKMRGRLDKGVYWTADVFYNDEWTQVEDCSDFLRGKSEHII